jgi:prepilin-type N-terminal cleavage/methylation domain-containing protein
MHRLKTTSSRTAFTLVELLVVIAVIALLIGILLPALGAARDTARSLVCQTKLRSLGQGQSFYMGENKDYWAGPNTSGAFGQGYTKSFQLMSETLYAGDKASATPTSTHDWISPILGDSMNLSPNRASRTQQIFNDLACPSARYRNDSVYLQGTKPSDRADFEKLVAKDPGYKQISYLSPSAFHYKPSQAVANKERITHPSLGAPITLKYNFTTPVTINPNFKPRFDLIGGQPANKVLAADGTRYYEGGQLDFDPALSPDWYGSFTDPGPIFHASTAYGRGFKDAPNNQLLSIRHRGEKINAVMFDGHTETLGKTRFYEDASLWYPGGSKFTPGGAATPEAMKKYKQNELIN